MKESHATKVLRITRGDFTPNPKGCTGVRYLGPHIDWSDEQRAIKELTDRPSVIKLPRGYLAPIKEGPNAQERAQHRDKVRQIQQSIARLKGKMKFHDFLQKTKEEKKAKAERRSRLFPVGC